MNSRTKKYYIGVRHNPQLNQPYIMAYGQLTKKEANRKTECVYGSLYIEGMDTKEAYEAKLEEYRSQGLSLRS